MDDNVKAYLEKNHAAAMITLRKNGTPHAVRVSVDVHGDKVWSSGTKDRARTRNLRRDPRASLFVIDSETEGSWRFLTLDCTVKLLDGPDAAELNVEFFKHLQSTMSPAPAPGTFSWFGRTMTEEEFLQAMKAEGRIIYEFTIERAYGMYGAMPGA